MFEWLSGYNYDYALASIPIQLVLIVFSLFRRHLPVKQSYFFHWIMFDNLIMTVADLISCELNEIWTSFPLSFMYFINHAYFIAFVCRGWLMFSYAFEVLNEKKRISTKWYYVCSALMAFVCGLIITTPWTGFIYKFYQDIGYRNGMLYKSIYVNTYGYIILSLIILAICWKKNNWSKRLCVLSFNLIIIAGIVLRSSFINTLVTSYFSILAILVIYLFEENPDMYVETSTGLLNDKAFTIVLDNYFDTDHFHLFWFLIKGYNRMRDMYGMHQVMIGFGKIAQYLTDTFPDMKIFYLKNGLFGFFSKKKIPVEMEKILHERFLNGWRGENTDIFFKISCIRMADDVKFESIPQAHQTVDMINTMIEKAGEASDVVIDERFLSMTRENIHIEDTLDDAVENGTVEVFFQPIVDAASEKVVGAEALARIFDKGGKIIPPDSFIPIAESNGLISDLGEQVYRKACIFMKETGIPRLGLKWININLSPVQCMDSCLPERFNEIRKEYDIPVEMLHLEITEASRVNNHVLKHQMTNMIDMGFCFVLDDYGSGYSDALRVKELPFINIKIDKEMTWAHLKNPDNLLPRSIAMFREMGMDVTAEGVENEEMARALYDIGATFLQGYHFSKPIPEQKFVEWCNKKNNPLHS